MAKNNKGKGAPRQSKNSKKAAGAKNLQISRQILNATPVTPAITGAKSSIPSPARVRPQYGGRTILLWLLPLTFCGILALSLFWRVPTRIAADLVVDRIAIVLQDGRESVPILARSTSFRLLTMEKFSRVALTPEKLEILTPAPAVGNDVWTPVSTKGVVTLRSTDEANATLAIERSGEAANTVGRLEALSVQPASTIVLQVNHASPPSLTLNIDGKQISPAVLPAGIFEILAHHAALDTTQPVKLSGDVIRLRAITQPMDPYLQIESLSRGLIVTITPVASSPTELFGSNGAAIKTLDLLKQDAAGTIETALVGPGKLRYLDYPEKKTVPLSGHESIRLAELTDASITALQFDPEVQAMRLQIQGNIGLIRTKSGSLTADHRATVLDWFYYNSLLKYIIGLIAAMWGSLVFWNEIVEFFPKFFHASKNSRTK